MNIEQNISLIRGDTGKYKINLVDENSNNIILGDGDQIYFTVKHNFETENVLLQKRISDGITLGDDNCYHLLLNSTDTDSLDYDNYVYDISVVIGSSEQQKKTVKRGIFKLEYEVTHVGNEV